MALGSNVAERSRKTDLIVRIQLQRLHNGMSLSEVKESTNRYRRKAVSELTQILKEEKQ